MEETPLETWKEIAAHLGVSVRCAQDWEKSRDLPVKRDGRGVKPRVVAYPRELDAWRREQFTTHRPVRRRRLRIALASVVVGASLVAAYLVHRSRERCPSIRTEVREGALDAIDGEGRICWSYPISGLSTTRYERIESGPGTQSWVDDLDGDGADEVIFVANTDRREAGSATVYRFEHGGSNPWTISLGQEWDIRGRHFDDAFIGLVLDEISIHGTTHLIVYARNTPSYPARLAFLDPVTGGITADYWHPGHVYDHELVDLDGDGEHELLLGGINNPDDGEGYPALLVLDVPLGPARSNPDRLFGSKYAVERDYLLFPRPDVFDAWGAKLAVDIVSSPEPGRISVTLGSTAARLHFGLDEKLAVVEIRPSDDLREAHTRLEIAGVLDHALTQEEIDSWRRVRRFPTAPNGNSEAVRTLLGD